MRLFATSVVALSLACLFAVSAPNAAHAAEPSTIKQPVYHTVVSGDTLDSIGRANGVSYLRIFYANEGIQHPDVIMTGQKFRIPSNDEQLAERAIATPAVVEQQYVAPATSPAPVSQVQPRVYQSNAPAVTTGSVWDSLAQCEAGGNWAISTGNGFYGGLQFTISSWRAVGGSGLPSEASREEQIMRGQMLQAMQGWGAWPACSAKLGLR